jgi:type VI secretion system protein ImpA
MFDPEKYLGPIGDADPAGPNLEYDPEFQALERAQAGRPEQVIGDTVKPGEDPDWADVQMRAQGMLSRTRDLRVAVPLAMASLKTDGFPGLAVGLAVIRGLLERQWDTVHPQLDADDDNDPTFRINSLAALGSVDGRQDIPPLLKALRVESVVQSKAIGRFSLRDIRVASGRQPAPVGSDPAQQIQIDAAFMDADLEALQASAGAIAGSLDQVTSIDRLLVDKVGDRAPNLKPLMVDLSEIRRILNEKLTARGAPTDMPDTESVTPPGTGPSMSGDIASRDDVARVLDRLCDYYRKYEPSSPIPLLLQRAKRLIHKDFLEIVRDLAPSGAAEAESIGGVEKHNG